MQKEEKLSYYINKVKELDVTKHERRIKVALLGSFTLNGFEETFRVKCSEQNTEATIYVAPYNQFHQEILNFQSGLYKFSPDITFLILDTRTILGDLFYFPYSLDGDEKKIFIQKKSQEIVDLAKTFSKNLNGKLVITNLGPITYDPYGIFETKTNYGSRDLVNDFNSQITSMTKDSESVYIYDFNGFVAQFGELNIFDYKQYFLGDIKISLDYIPYLVTDLMGFIKTGIGLSKKCIVLDLDNTLWGGVIGEDGFDGIKIANTPVGRAFSEFQKRLLALNKRGIILAINSKNNEDEALHVIRDHPDMVLREEHFASMKINWNDKSQNMKEIAADLNIGMDSMVFFDDDPINREYIRTTLPQILTVDLPHDPSEYAQTLMQMNDFQVWKITKEDIERGQMYLQEKQRKDLEKSAPNLDEFLKNLNLKLIIKPANGFTIPRISQLTLKTNQFNLTTRRYQEEDIKKFSNQDNYLIGCGQVEDKFGNSGITGVFIVKKDPNEWFIDTFLLSCRIMGRGIEDGMMGYLLRQAKNEGAGTVRAEFIPTKKNIPSESFLSSYGFKKDGQYWIYSLKDQPIKTPSYLELSVE